ncbi:MAG: protein kinase, partial [Planctomycetota bacterium]
MSSTSKSAPNQPTELKRYAASIVRSGLMSSDDVKRHYSRFLESIGGEENEDVENGGPFANYLQQQDLLTAWQNRKLLKGRYRQLMFGKFRVMHLLGVGGMGRVYLAENRLLEKKVALKVLPSARSHNPSSLARFQREARALARLNHPNIVR